MSHEQPYHTGQRILLTNIDLPFSKKNLAGELIPTNPPSATLTVRLPSGDLSVKSWPDPGPQGTLDHPGVGGVETEVTPEAGEEGRWYFRFEGEGEVEAVD